MPLNQPNMKIALLLPCFILFSIGLKGQASKNEKYKPVNIDSLLKTPVILPKEGYSITNIQFTANYDKNLGAISGVHRHRFLMFQRQHPEVMWQFADHSGQFKVGDSSLYIPIGGEDRRLFNLIWDSWGDQFGPKLILHVQMLIGKFERYGITRDFIIRDIIMPTE